MFINLWKPSDIVLLVPPLSGSFPKVELEQAAAVIVRVCQVLGNRWQAVELKKSQAILRGEMKEGTSMGKAAKRRDFNPDFVDLVLQGFAFCNEAKDTIELTQLGLDRVARWRRNV